MTTAPTKTPKSKPMRAGGRATEAGMAFQAAVATWFAVHILARLPVGGRFGINNTALPVAIRLETGAGLDDIEDSQSDGGALHIQNKTSATLATGDKAPLAKTGAQLADWRSEAKAPGTAPDPTRSAAVLAMRADASGTLDDLEARCRAFDLGGAWAITKAGRNAAQRTALSALETIVTAAWTAERLRRDGFGGANGGEGGVQRHGVLPGGLRVDRDIGRYPTRRSRRKTASGTSARP